MGKVTLFISQVYWYLVTLKIPFNTKSDVAVRRNFELNSEIRRKQFQKLRPKKSQKQQNTTQLHSYSVQQNLFMLFRENF